jgi:hypothetical protein
VTTADETDELADELKQSVREERREARAAAGAFADICKKGRVDELYEAAHRLDYCVDAWGLALRKVARLPSVTPEIRNAFVSIWVEHKMLALSVGNRHVLADALRLLLPGDYSGPPLTLYRGTSAQERRRRIYGFSWTTDVAIARKFAERCRPMPELFPLGSGPWEYKKWDGGVILKTVAPPEAVLLIRKPEDYYDEGEVVVDPFRLSKIELIERLLPRAHGDHPGAETA